MKSKKKNEFLYRQLIASKHQKFRPSQRKFFRTKYNVRADNALGRSRLKYFFASCFRMRCNGGKQWHCSKPRCKFAITRHQCQNLTHFITTFASQEYCYWFVCNPLEPNQSHKKFQKSIAQIELAEIEYSERQRKQMQIINIMRMGKPTHVNQSRG